MAGGNGFWNPLPGSTDALDDLSDVDTTTTPPADGDSLVYNSVSGRWEPAAVSGGSGSSTVLFVRKTADESVASSAVSQDDDELVLAVAANAVYVLNGIIFYTGANAADIRVQWAVPTGATLDWFSGGLQAGGTTSGDLYAGNLGAGVDLGLAAGSTTVPNGAHVHGLLVTGSTAGNLQLRWAQISASGTATVVKANSFIELHER